MPRGEVVLVPGANVERTPTLNQTGYLRTAMGRFKDGLFQKLGGWTKYFSGAFPGTVKSLWAWQDLNQIKWLSVASTTAVTVVATGVPQVITPQVLQSDFTPDFSTTNGSNSVEVVDPNISGLTTDVVVEFRTPISVGGLILSGTYSIATITGADSYTIEAGANATATVANGGAVPEFVTTTGSATVAVNLNDHGQTRGNIVVFPVATSVGGVTVQGKYTVTAVNSVNQFTITASTAATSNATVSMNAGDARINYHIALGPTASGVGYGVGGYGEGAYGKGTSSTGVQTGTPITADDWTQDNWGEILIACPKSMGIYYWQPGTGYQNLALIPNGPLFNDGAFISMAQQQVIAWGSSIDARIGGGIGIYQDPLLVQWSTIGDFFDWEPRADNFARNLRIPTGSRCVGGGATKNRNLIWTDLDVYTLNFNSGDSVYTPNRVGSNCGLIGMHAWAQYADTVYWMGVGNFFSYSGSGVAPLECPIWDAVFQDINPTYQHRVVAGSNGDFSEIWFWYPSLASNGELDKGVKYNVTQGTWDFDIPPRCAWVDRSVLGNPIGASNAGIVYSHESGFDDDGNPITPIMETGDFYLSEGQDFCFIDEVWPDFKWGPFGGSETAQIQVTLLCRDEPGEDYREYGPFVVNKSSPFISPFDSDGITRPRARQAALRVSSIDVGSFWRLGKIRFRYAVDGRR
jgi:hypothetical protein